MSIILHFFSIVAILFVTHPLRARVSPRSESRSLLVVKQGLPQLVERTDCTNAFARGVLVSANNLISTFPASPPVFLPAKMVALEVQ